MSSVPTHEAGIRRALERVEAHLAEAATAGAVLSRREAGRPAPGDAARTDELVAGLVGHQQDDGGWPGGLVATAETLLLLHALRPPAGSAPAGFAAAAAERAGAVEPAADDIAFDAAIARGLDWLRARQGAPGRFAGDCSPQRHDAGLCAHFMAGFFSPAPPDPPLETLRLASGAEIAGDDAARLVASCVALECALRWGLRDSDVELHLQALREIVELADRWNHELVRPPAYAAALLVLIRTPGAEPPRDLVETALALITRAQRGDATWSDIDSVQVLDLLRAAARRGCGGDAVRNAILRGAGLLAIAQQSDGTWGRSDDGLRTLIGWRVLRFAIGLDEGAA